MTHEKRKAGKEQPITPGIVRTTDFEPSAAVYAIFDNSVVVNGATRLNGIKRFSLR